MAEKLIIKPEKVLEGRDFPVIDEFGHRLAVCKRCCCIMSDCEPCYRYGEFWHPLTNKKGKPHSCKNAGKYFDMTSPEIEPFMKKSRRRALKRMKIRA